MAVVRVEVGGLMYVTCEIQPLNGMEWVLPGAGGARDYGLWVGVRRTLATV